MGLSHVVCACIFVVAFYDSRTDAFPDFIEENGLNINGSNICFYPTSKTVKVAIEVEVLKRVPYIATCYHYFYISIFIWKTIKFNCTKYKNVIEVDRKTHLKKLHGYTLRCCHGWKKINQTDTECLKPICVHGCQHGKCVAADTCACDPGWTGYTCGMDVNECYNFSKGCQQECVNTPGSYKCGCRRGYTIHPKDNTKCIDINECSSTQPRCHCPDGDSACTATCVNIIGSFKCVCSKGYRLNGPRNCSDVDECLSGITNNCQNKCINKPGSYQCTCFDGLKYDKNTGACEDVNECADNKGGCEHTCVNMYGTYRCRCNRGYRMAPDRKKCRPFKVMIP